MPCQIQLLIRRECPCTFSGGTNTCLFHKPLGTSSSVSRDSHFQWMISYIKQMQIHNAKIYFLLLCLHGMVSWLPPEQSTVHQSFVLRSVCTCSYTQNHKDAECHYTEGSTSSGAEWKALLSLQVGADFHEWTLCASRLHFYEQYWNSLKSLKMPKDHPSPIHDSYYPLRKKEMCCCYPFAKVCRWLYYVL